MDDLQKGIMTELINKKLVGIKVINKDKLKEQFKENTKDEFENAIESLIRGGEIYEPKKGFVEVLY